MIDVLPDIGVNPDYGLSQGGEFRVKEVGFGDGYTQRMPDGLNATRRSWSLKWSNLDRWQVDTLYDFLLKQQGVYSFLWNVPDTDDAYRVVCKKKPKRVSADYSSYTLEAEFTEDFTP